MKPHGGEPFALLYDDTLRLLLFGGKGGVGKTTLAAAFSLYLSDRHPQKRFLVVSTDPAHSLSDSFDDPIGSAPGPVYRRANLSGLEIDAEKLFTRFREENGRALQKILGRGTYLDEEDLSRLLELSFPGLDEVMALLQIIDLVESRGDPAGRPYYDLVIVDTAPTGHTLRLLDLPVLMQGWVAYLDTLMAKHRYLSRVYTRAYRPDEADAFITGLAGDIQRIRKLLQDERRCRFVPITLAEPVVLSETRRLLLALAERGISVKEVLVNQMMIDPPSCERCRAVAGAQRLHLETFQREWPALRVIPLPASPQEVRGEEGLRAFAGGALAPTDHLPDGECGSVGVWECGSDPHTPIPPYSHTVCSPSLPLSHSGRRGGWDIPRLPVRISAPEPHLQLFLFCGKGGVGKTTLSSAFALQLSRRFPEKRVLLFSTDPAHSLSDCLGEYIGPAETRVGGRENLFAVEIDPASLFSAFKRSYAAQIEEVFKGFSWRAGVEVRFDGEVLADLLDLAPPGLDEIMALSELADYVEEDRYDLYVLDLAPTGHALRFLELPDLVQDWLRAFFEIVLKYRNVIGLPRTLELLVKMSKKVKRIQRLLSDPGRCEGIPVAIPTELALRETRRLISDLEGAVGAHGRAPPLRRLLVNRVVPPHSPTPPLPEGESGRGGEGGDERGGCGYCDALAREHERMLHRFREALPELEMVLLPQVSEELKGADALEGFIRFA